MSNCPSLEQLARLLDEALGAREAETLSDHVEFCAACRQTLDVLVDRPLVDASAGDHPPALPGSKPPGAIGDYEVLGICGSGSSATVYRARHRDLDRLVAVKVLHAHAAEHSERLARFRREAGTLARLRHPNLLQVFEAGDHEGRPYLVLEYVDGGSLADWLRGAPQHPRTAAALVERVARAIAHAHAAGIIHRDLKPANILLCDAEHTPRSSGQRIGLAMKQPKVADFGIAKALGDGAGMTRSDMLLGTPSYLAPEQAKASPDELTSACDIYALGVLLYEMLTGRPPLVGPGVLATLRLVATTEPVAPRRLQPQVPADLETICLKCLAKDPARRYGSADELAEDLARFQAARPIRARRVGHVERSWLWCRRNPAVASLVGLLALSIVGGGLGMFGLLMHASRQAMLATANARRLGDHAYLSDLRFAAGAFEANHMRLFREVLAAQLPEAAGGVDRRNFEWYYWRRLADLEQFTLQAHEGWVNSVHISPDGKRLASASDDGTLALWRVHPAALDRVLKLDAKRVFAARFSPDGRWLATVDSNRRLQLHDPSTGQVQRKLPTHAQWPQLLCFSPDGQRLATAARDGKVRLWNIATGQEERSFNCAGQCASSLAFSPDGQVLATADSDPSVLLWDVSTGKLHRSLDFAGEAIMSVAFHADGRRLAAGCQRGRIVLWDLKSNRPVQQFDGHQGWVTSLAFHSDGVRLISGSADRTVRLWWLDGSRESRCFQGHTEWISDVCFHPDGQQIASASRDGTLKLWSVDASTGVQDLHIGPMQSALVRPESAEVAAAIGNEIEIWNVLSLERRRLTGHTEAVVAMCFDPAGKRLASAARDNTVRLWQLDRPPASRVVLARRMASSIAFSPDGRQLAMSTDDGELLLTACQRPIEPRVLEGGVLPRSCVAWSPDNRHLAIGGSDGVLEVRELPGGRKVWRTNAHYLRITSVVFSTSGDQIATSSAGRQASVWNAHTGELVVTLKGHLRAIAQICFSPDGRRLATVSADRTMRLWTADTGQELIQAKSVDGPYSSISFSSDGQCLAAGLPSAIRLWHAPR